MSKPLFVYKDMSDDDAMAILMGHRSGRRTQSSHVAETSSSDLDDVSDWLNGGFEFVSRGLCGVETIGNGSVVGYERRVTLKRSGEGEVVVPATWRLVPAGANVSVTTIVCYNSNYYVPVSSVSR